MGIINDSLNDLKYNFVLVLLPFLVLGFFILMFFNENKASKQKSYEHQHLHLNVNSKEAEGDASAETRVEE